jgi:hypothetical protein
MRLGLNHPHNILPSYYNNLMFLMYLRLLATEYDIHKHTMLRLS